MMKTQVTFASAIPYSSLTDEGIFWCNHRRGARFQSLRRVFFSATLRDSFMMCVTDSTMMMVRIRILRVRGFFSQVRSNSYFRPGSVVLAPFDRHFPSPWA